jgi:hypothetical protein
MLSDGPNEPAVVAPTEIAATLGFVNRSSAPRTHVTSPLRGILVGAYRRPFLRGVIEWRGKRMQVAFFVALGVRGTFLGKATWDELVAGRADTTGEHTIRVTLNGETRQEVRLSPQDEQFADMDVLGTDFLTHMDAQFSVDYKKKTCCMEWEDLD